MLVYRFMQRAMSYFTAISWTMRNRKSNEMKREGTHRTNEEIRVKSLRVGIIPAYHRLGMLSFSFCVSCDARDAQNAEI